MIKKFNFLFLSMCAVGNSKYAPGTVASFITSLIFILFYNLNINILILSIVVCIIFIYSVYAIDEYKNSFSEVDAKEIVIDEFVGQSIPILTVYSFIEMHNITNFILYSFVAFALFRFFDIAKPYPINIIDKNMKNGFGVMLDDIIAGVYSSIVLLLIMTFINNV